MTACAPKESANSAGDKGQADAITVDASDNGCKLSVAQANTGPSTFVITNNGSKVTEFYVYGAGDRVLGEVENISPGLQRKLIVQLGEPGTYVTACKPGMIGDGIRGNFTVTGNAVNVGTDARFKQAADGYKNYVISQLNELITATTAFTDAVKKGDIAGAKTEYPKARTYYERIEPVAESFPDDLDPRIDLREADLQAGQKWTGFHRLEKDLWVTGLQPDTNAIGDQLVADVKELDAGVKDPKWTIDPTHIAGGAQGLLDEIAKTKISGEEDIFSHTDLWDFQANVDGSRTAVGSVRPILDARDKALGARVDAAFATVQSLLDKYRQGDGFVSYDKVTEPERQALSQAIDALSKEVSQVQGVIAQR
ncbi:iron uptake system protein EfeO [Mycobacterium sp. MAA66]|uniref:iron uptake system protein EfeO n=1 Tax=Mycobacterium sp. MAA66 TaxID=3156297 RepID=UPI0035165A94